MHPNRRAFLFDVGRGAVTAGLGYALARDLGLALADAPAADRLTFGPLEPLVALLQDTPPDKLLPLVVDRLRTGTTLQQVVGAAALANARAFGGEDYVGYHTLMALSPAYHMARETPGPQQPLPVLKVLYRNISCITNAHHGDAMKPVAAGDAKADGVAIRDAARRKDKTAAEGSLAAAANANDALDLMLCAVEDATEVHRVALAWRSWDLLDLVGREHAKTLLRQSVRYCANMENPNYVNSCGTARTVVPKVLDSHKLPGRGLGSKPASDARLLELSDTIFRSTPEQAAGAAAEALAQGLSPKSVGEAITLAANQLALRDHGRPANQTQANKPPGSVHGDSIGVHACDSANAWRQLALAGNPMHTCACLLLGAYQAAYDRTNRGGDFLNWEPYPPAEAREKVAKVDAEKLLAEAEAAIRDRDQGRAAAAVTRWLELGRSEQPVFDLMRRYAISEDGALHAEKFYRTSAEEFAAARPATRGRYLVALARVTASAFGYAAPGLDQAKRLLG